MTVGELGRSLSLRRGKGDRKSLVISLDQKKEIRMTKGSHLRHPESRQGGGERKVFCPPVEGREERKRKARKGGGQGLIDFKGRHSTTKSKRQYYAAIFGRVNAIKSRTMREGKQGVAVALIAMLLPNLNQQTQNRSEVRQRERQKKLSKKALLVEKNTDLVSAKRILGEIRRKALHSTPWQGSKGKEGTALFRGKGDMAQA